MEGAVGLEVNLQRRAERGPADDECTIGCGGVLARDNVATDRPCAEVLRGFATNTRLAPVGGEVEELGGFIAFVAPVVEYRRRQEHRSALLWVPVDLEAVVLTWPALVDR